jgi:DNA (cytosine-5)-methyltransferase 1
MRSDDVENVTPPLKVLDLFSGIGGFSLGLERTQGFKTVAFCEIDPFCRRVLAKHWPQVPCYDDVRTLTGARLAADGIAVDVICGGFPCQDVSTAGKRAGLEGARSGLWSEYRRLISELRPRFLIVENVPGLLSLGLGTVLGDLSEIGFDAVWDCVPACAIGAPHRRDRVWLVAHASGTGRQQVAGSASGHESPHEGRPAQSHHLTPGHGEGNGATALANANSRGCEREREPEHGQQQGTPRREPNGCGAGRRWGRKALANANSHIDQRGACFVPVGRVRRSREASDDGDPGRTQWSSEPDVGRVAHGVPNRVDRLRALGNAVVPQIPELIGRAILEAQIDLEGAKASR